MIHDKSLNPGHIFLGLLGIIKGLGGLGLDLKIQFFRARRRLAVLESMIL